MTLKQSTGLRNSMVGSTGFSGALNGGVILALSGPQPVTADAALTGTILGIGTLNGGAWVAGSPTNGLIFDTPAGGGVSKPPGAAWKIKGVAAGTIGHFRFVGNADDDGAVSATLPRLDGAAAIGAGDARFSSLVIAVGQEVTVDVFSYKLPAQ